jgi:hypothetical protein
MGFQVFLPAELRETWRRKVRSSYSQMQGGVKLIYIPFVKEHTETIKKEHVNGKNCF